MNPNELNSELTGLNKGEKQQKIKQLIIYISIGAVGLIALIVLIVLVAKSKGSDSKKTIGEINCDYEVKTITQNTQLLGKEFNIRNNQFDIYIDGKKIKYSKEYKFKTADSHKVQIKIYDKINMDNMFKGVSELVSVEMISSKNCQILSMTSTFENCENLRSFNITGFNGENLKSMKKLFYQT